MALQASRWYTVLTMKDQGGNTFRRTYEQSAPADYAAALASQTALATDLQAVSNCQIVKAVTFQEYEEDTTFVGTAEGENQALITVGLANKPLDSATLNIPAPVDSIFVGTSGPNRNVVKEPADSAILAAFLANFDSEALFYVSDGEQMDGFKKGKRIHKKSLSG